MVGDVFRVRNVVQERRPANARSSADLAAVDVVSLQHEFGLYGTWPDPFEDHVTSFLGVLETPLQRWMTECHAALPRVRHTGATRLQRPPTVVLPRAWSRGR